MADGDSNIVGYRAILLVRTWIDVRGGRQVVTHFEAGRVGSYMTTVSKMYLPSRLRDELRRIRHGRPKILLIIALGSHSSCLDI